MIEQESSPQTTKPDAASRKLTTRMTPFGPVSTEYPEGTPEADEDLSGKVFVLAMDEIHRKKAAAK